MRVIKALLQIYFRTSGIKVARQHFLTFLKIGMGVCKLFFFHQRTKHTLKNVSKFSCVLITRFLAVWCLFHGAI